MFRKLKILRETFPNSWIRKSIFLLFPTKTITINNKIAGFLTTKGKKIILLYVSNEFRRKGIASQLLKETKATHAYTFADNKAAIDAYLKNGFRVDSYKNSMFGKKVRLVRKNV